MNFFNDIYDVFTNPAEFFKIVKERGAQQSLLPAILAITVVNAVFFTLKYEFVPENLGYYLPFLVLSCLWGIVLFYIVGGFFHFLMRTFGKEGRMKEFMYCLGFCVFPLVLFAPVQLLKPMGQTGHFLAVVTEVLIYFWSVYLMAKSIEITYELSFSRAVIIILLPFICSFISLFWLIEFISKMVYIFKI